MEVPNVGDYVLATKYEDGDPGDMWALGFYDGVRDDHGRHYVKDSAGKQIRGNGFRKVAPIREDVGRWLLEVAAPHLERCPAKERALQTRPETTAKLLGRRCPK